MSATNASNGLLYASDSYDRSARARDESVLAKPLAAVFILLLSVTLWGMIWYFAGLGYGLLRGLLG